MKHLGVALITLFMLAGALVSDVNSNVSEEDSDGWGVFAGVTVIFALWWFWHHRDPDVD